MSETENMSYETITVLTDDDREIECAIVADFGFKGKKYYVLAEIKEDDTLADVTWLYRYEEYDDGIELIDPEEKELVAAVEYYERMTEK